MPSEQLVPVSQEDRVERVARAIYAVRPFTFASTATTFGAQIAQTFDWDGAPAYYQADMLDLARAALATLSPQEPSSVIAALEARVAGLTGALKGMTERYVDLVNCGDCGNWNPETEDEVKAARTALENTNGQG